MAIQSTRIAAERDDRRRQVAEMYLRGKMQTEIAAELGKDTATISRDLKAIRSEWRSSTLVDFNEAKNRELAKIDALEAEYLKAWERSIGTHTTVKVEYRELVPVEGEPESEAGAELRQAVRRTEDTQQLNGNPAYLAGVMSCIEQRCKILGIYEAAKISIDWRSAVEKQGHNAGELFERMVNAYISAVGGDTV